VGKAATGAGYCAEVVAGDDTVLGASGSGGVAFGKVTDAMIALASADTLWRAGSLVPSAPATNASVATGSTYIVQGPSLASGSARRIHVEWTADINGTEYQF